jgi:DNA-binding NtrC family response regulator
MASILVVDDDEHVRILIKDILETGLHESIGVGSAKEALQFCRQKSFDLIVTDLSMPGISGLELIRALRTASIKVPVLLISGTLDDHIRRAAMLFDAVETLCKPFGLVDLLAAVDKTLEHHRQKRRQVVTDVKTETEKSVRAKPRG